MNNAVAKLHTKQSLSSKFAERFNVDETEVKNILKATAFKVKDGVVTDEQMSSLMIIANEYNLNPFTKEIYAYPDKGAIVPVVGVDGWTRIINEHPQMDGVEFVYSDETVQHKGKECHVWIEAIITRKDRSKPIVVREYFDEVVRIVNFATPWDSHPKRMHRHKTLIQAARLAFGFSGVYDEDEAARIIEKDVTGEGSHQTEQPKPQPTYYTDEEFTANSAKWEKLVNEGKKTATELVAFVESRGKVFTEHQLGIVGGWKKAEVIEGVLVDDFVKELNEAEGN